MSHTLAKTIEKIAEKTESILLLGDPVLALESHHLTYLPDLAGRDFSKLGHFDLVVFNNVLNKVSVTEAERLIAQVRDQYSKQLMLIEAETGCLTDSHFLQLGLRQLVKSDPEAQLPDVWYFSLESYKRVPDWLNSQYWANPEMFEKYRW